MGFIFNRLKRNYKIIANVSLILVFMTPLYSTAQATSSWETRDRSAVKSRISTLLNSACKEAMNENYVAAEAELEEAVFEVFSNNVMDDPDNTVNVFCTQMGLDNLQVKPETVMNIFRQTTGHTQIMTIHLREINNHFSISTEAVPFSISKNASTEETEALRTYNKAIIDIRARLIKQIANSIARVISARVFCQDIISEELKNFQFVSEQSAKILTESRGQYQAVEATIRQILRNKSLPENKLETELFPKANDYVTKNSIRSSDLFETWRANASRHLKGLRERAKYPGGKIPAGAPRYEEKSGTFPGGGTYHYSYSGGGSSGGFGDDFFKDFFSSFGGFGGFGSTYTYSDREKMRTESDKAETQRKKAEQDAEAAKNAPWAPNLAGPKAQSVLQTLQAQGKNNVLNSNYWAEVIEGSTGQGYLLRVIRDTKNTVAFGTKLYLHADKAGDAIIPSGTILGIRLVKKEIDTPWGSLQFALGIEK